MSDFFYILKGSLLTLEFTLLSLVVGAVIGLGLALLKVSQLPVGFQFARAYTSFFRGTPLLVQLSMIYFGAPFLFNYKITAFFAGIIAFSLNSGAYLSETLRAGIQAVDIGQYEAAQVLKIPYFYTLKDIILPQAFRNILPALANESISLLKETALISTLGEEDLMRRAQIVAAEKYSYFGPLFIAAGGYYVLILLIGFIFKNIERRLSYDSNQVVE